MAEPVESEPVGFIGVGQMGRPMVDRLVAAGFPVTAYVRRPDLAAELATEGVVVVSSASEAASAAAVLVVCLFSDAQVRHVLLDDPAVLGGLHPGSRVVNHVTGSPEVSMAVAEALPPGVGYVDAPMSGSSDDIRAGRLSLLVGAADDDLEAIRAVVGAYSSTIVHAGVAVGDGQRVKLVNNLLFTVNLRVAMEAVRLGETLGVAPADLARCLTRCSGHSYALALFEHLAPETMAVAGKPYLVKDVAVVRSVAEAMGADLGILGELARWVESA